MAHQLDPPPASADFASPLEHLQLPLGIVWKLGNGDPLTPEEQVAWDVYQAACAEQEAQRDLLGIVDLGEVMRSGSTEPEMLVPDLLVRALHHLWYGRKESAKTWIALYAAACMIARGQSVVWVDKEMGSRDIADRMKSLGVLSDLVDEYLVYCEFPVLDGSNASRELWEAMLRALRPALLVVDAQTEVLADAGLNENSGTDVERWTQWYITPARRLGTTTVMLDHTGHSEQGRAVATRQKGAAAKVELAFEVVTAFDRETVGKLKISRNKNTVSAPIPEVQWWRIGGTPLEIAPDALPDSGASDAGAAWEIRMAIVELLTKRTGEKLSQRQVFGMVAGTDKTKRRVLDELAQDETSTVQVEPRGQSLLYFVEAPGAAEGLQGSPPPADAAVGKSDTPRSAAVRRSSPETAKTSDKTAATKPRRSRRTTAAKTAAKPRLQSGSNAAVERSRKDRRNETQRARRAAKKEARDGR